MRVTKQARRDGKSLFRACLAGGRLDETSVRTVVSRLIEGKPRGYLKTLGYFHRLVKLHLDRRSARVENAVASSPELMNSLTASLEARYGPGLDLTFWIDPSHLGGLRIRVGSDVYDGTVKARLEGLKSEF